jgi:DNA polymerase-1
MGVFPEQITDLLGLMGDAADNLPGVTGVGEKTAAKLIGEHGTLEAVLAAAEGMKKGKQRERLLAEAENARLSKKLATLCREVPLEVKPADLEVKPPEPKALDAFLEEYDIGSLRKGLVPARRSIDTSHYATILDRKALEALVKRAQQTKECALDLETTALDAVRAQVVGISLCPAEGEAAYIPVAHEGADAPKQLPLDDVLESLRPLFEDPGIKLVGQNLKYDSIVLANRHGIRLDRIACDSMLASYVLDPGRASQGLDSLARDFLQHEPITYQSVTGKGKDQIPFAQVDVRTATAYSGEDADLSLRMCHLLLPRVREAKLLPLLEQIELPLVPVLRDLELAGVRVDPAKLAALSKEMERELDQLQNRIFALAGHEFNINSPAQLRTILFEELKLPPSKQTKSGASTDQSVLEELAVEHELPAELLNYRSLAKLKSTYADVLPEMINPETGRIHTSFNQAITATGRLSSSDPNLQNIPVRTEMGRRIREAFVAPEGSLLLSADYSQVELRVLAHVCGDPAMLEAFRGNEDVHARTASRVFGVPIAQVTSEMRRRAKAVNFGIVYGQGAFNLAKQLRIPRAEAKEIIDSHQRSYPKVQQWVAGVQEAARRDGFVTTLFGRRRFLPDIHSANHNARANAERMAQNTPIQGSAADIIKRAMIDLHRELLARRLKARMVLQVHDELVFEVGRREADLLEELVREKMEGAAELRVPLTVDVSTGSSWAEAH